MRDKPVYVFDGHCILCSRAVQYVLKHERSPDMRFVAIQSTEGREVAKNNQVDPDDPSTFLLVINDRVLKSSDALVALIRYAGGPARALLPFRFLPRRVRDWLYARIAKNRYRIFGETDTCFVPDPETRARFVLPEPERAG